MQKTWEDDVTLEQIKTEYKEVVDAFPALHKYKSEHNIANLQKLCVEIADFCNAVYASTRNEKERDVYCKMLERLRQNHRI